MPKGLLRRVAVAVAATTGAAIRNTTSPDISRSPILFRVESLLELFGATTSTNFLAVTLDGKNPCTLQGRRNVPNKKENSIHSIADQDENAHVETFSLSPFAASPRGVRCSCSKSNIAVERHPSVRPHPTSSMSSCLGKVKGLRGDYRSRLRK